MAPQDKTWIMRKAAPQPHMLTYLLRSSLRSQIFWVMAALMDVSGVIWVVMSVD
jgi:hypothetical protein